VNDRSPNHFALDESENALDYLRRADRFIYEAQRDAIAWKWVMISLHGALYGFAISTCPNMTWKAPGDHERSLDRFIGRRLKEGPALPPDNAKLVSIDWAIRICLRQPGLPLPGGRPYTVTDLQTRSLEQLTRYRNGFMHFHRQRVIVPGNELPLIASEVLDVIHLCVSISCIGHEMQDEVDAIISHAKAGLCQDEVNRLRERATIAKS
jgi:hypothetical protein